MAVTLDVFHEFDPTVWQIASPAAAGSSLLLTWRVTPQPPDGGMPDCVMQVFAQALCSMGPVVFAGDEEDGDSRCFQELVIRRGLRRLNLALYCANSIAQLLPAFASGRHDWSMNAQWLVVMGSRTADNDIVAAVRTLYEEWALPEPWPSGALMIVQAAVDGDGAACFSANKTVEEVFVEALGKSARAADFEMRIDPDAHA